MKMRTRLLWLTTLMLIVGLLAVRLSVIWPSLVSEVQHKGTQTSIKGQKNTTNTAIVTPTPTPPPLRPDLATGISFPQWGSNAYSSTDKNWTQGLQEIKSQTAARWVSISLQFHQASEYTTQVYLNNDAPQPDGLKAGIELAHKMGYHVYVFPLITLDGPHAWAGYLKYQTDLQNQAWFDSYWQMLKPYAETCQEVGCDEMGIGNEFEGLQQSPDAYWHQLLVRVHSVYTGKIVYSVNFSSLQLYPIPQWFSDPLLAEIGVSTYYSLTDTESRIPEDQMPALWKSRVEGPLDHLAQIMAKPIFISEIGYRDTSYAGYLPYEASDSGSHDDAEQAALYNAALQNIATDKNINGIFVWGWSQPAFAPNYKPAARVLHLWYTKLSY